MDLQTRFYKVMQHFSSDVATAFGYWQQLDAFYSESFRAYHNFKHLEALFRFFDEYKAALAYPEEVAYAIFYHDSIYNIWRKDNEWRSAELAVKHIAPFTPDVLSSERIRLLIMATKHHKPGLNTDEKWMVDFDIAILGQSWDTYFNYTKQIRTEYATVPNFMYKKGRRKALQHFLNASRIYQTQPFYEAFEMNARYNLNKELELL